MIAAPGYKTPSFVMEGASVFPANRIAIRRHLRSERREAFTNKAGARNYAHARRLWGAGIPQKAAMVMSGKPMDATTARSWVNKINKLAKKLLGK